MKNYIGHAFGLTLLVTVMLLAIRYLPGDSLQKAGLKSADILADLNAGNDWEDVDRLPAEYGAGPATNQGYSAVSILDIDPEVSDTVVETSVIVVDHTNNDYTPAEPLVEEGDDSKQAVEEPASAPATEGELIPIIDYSHGGTMLATFQGKMHNIPSLGRPLRIGFMGDSFIEGDLLTSDFREMMQTAYGGGGVGFVPITSQVAGFRQTVVHRFGNWKQRSIVNNKDKGFTISAYNFIPSEGSYVEYKGSKHKRHLDRFDKARLLFVSKGATTVKAVVNGDEAFEFLTEPSETLQQVLLEGDISSIRYSVNNVDGFSALGVFLENSEGVCVDNFSVRGNSGTPMNRIDPVLSGQFGKLSRYDLIVLEYGLNVVSSDNTNYSAYRDQMIEVVEHIKSCFPDVAILLMSVADRATRRNGQFVTMPGVLAMVKVQQEIARDCGILFWNTCEMMRAAGGMEAFVKRGWAAKDYTHIGAKGGHKIASELFRAITSPY